MYKETNEPSDSDAETTFSSKTSCMRCLYN